MATYYISPEGYDGDDTGAPGYVSAKNPWDGTTTYPWYTFSYALAQLGAGDTLYLKDGTYTPSTTETLVINTSYYKPANATQTIHVKAVNERKAYIKGNGGSSRPILILNQAYWHIEGIWAEDVDADIGGGTEQGSVCVIYTSTDCELYRCLFRYNNRYFNSHLIECYTSHRNLILECELLETNGHAIDIASSNYNVVRRCYLNDRDYPNITGGYNGRNDSAGVAVYPGSYNVIENCVGEGSSGSFQVNASNTSTGNWFMGCISINCDNGRFGAFYANSRLDQAPEHTTFTNCVAIDCDFYQFQSRCGSYTTFKNCTALSGTTYDDFYADYQSDYGGGYTIQITFENCLTTSSFRNGFALDDTYGTPGYTFTNCNAYNASSHNYNVFGVYTTPAGCGTTDPGLTTEKCYVPAASAMGLLGIGANVIYRFETTPGDIPSGTPTATRLWIDEDKGAGSVSCFPHGALVSGVNNSADGTFANGSAYNTWFGASSRFGTMLAGASTTPANYYVDATSGSDSNDGMSQGAPWKTISKVNAYTAQPDDGIFFKRGETWTEALTATGSGTSGHPVTYASYGTGAAPIIDGEGTRDHCIDCAGYDYLEIKRLHVKDGKVANIIVDGDNSKVFLCLSTGGTADAIKVTGASNQLLHVTQDGAGADGYKIDEDCTITNCIGYNNTGDDIEIANTKTVTGTYNLFQDAAKAGAGTYSDGSATTKWTNNPTFVGSGDYSLQSSSTCIDYATDLAYSSDIIGNPMPIGSKPDVGAYEYQTSVSTTWQKHCGMFITG